MAKLSVHDNWVYAQAVDYETCRVVLYTVFPHSQPPEYTDIAFEGVVVHHFERQLTGGSSGPANVLFDVEEADPLHVFAEFKGVIDRLKNHGWPVAEYTDVDDLVAKLTRAGAICYTVHGSCGLDGFVFASSVQFLPRPSRAEVV